MIDAARVDPEFGAEIVGVISDNPHAGGLDKARQAGIESRVVRWSDFASRDAFTAGICVAADDVGADALVLAGFMRVLGREAVERFEILNIHPALCPSFPGARAVEEALDYGVKVTGVTVHFVDEFVDHGPIIAQEPVRVEPGDTAATLHERIRKVEHRLYPEVVKAFANGRLARTGRTVRWSQP